MRIARWFAASLGVLIALLGLGIWLLFRASLPQLDGRVSADGLGTLAAIERDRHGTPTIVAADRGDLAFATGYAHAQDRFFQMDLLRRSAAGELAELLGPALIDSDKRLRVHGFREVARAVLEDATESRRAILDAYVAGVNAGLRGLDARPWEYWVLGAEPAAWRAEDSILVAFSRYLTLNDSTGEAELARAYLRQVLPEELYAFLHPLGTEWDAPLTGGIWRTPAVPGAQVFDMRHRAPQVGEAIPASKLEVEPAPIFGSNSWAVAATHTASGAALLANDMHLTLRLPNTWYRARLIVEASGDAARDLIGVTLPGLPLLIAGSNGRVAWGYTNSYGDWTDLVVVELDPADPARYAVGSSWQPVITRRETVQVRGAAPVTVEVKTTRWGPIVGHDAQGRPLALAWTAHHREATNLGMLDFEATGDVTELLNAASRAGGPVQNVIAADARGSIGWSLLGRVPIRANYDSTRPSSWRDAGTGWIGWRSPSEYPRIVDPPTGRLWTANARTLDARAWLDFLGEGGHDLGARAAQIREGLLALSNASVEDFVRIQTDDRALFLARWRDLLLDLLDAAALESSPTRAEARGLVEHWSGRADTDDAGYRIVRAFRLQVRKQVFDWFTVEARMQHPELRFAPTAQFEGPLWQLVTERPLHLLDPQFSSWRDALLESLDRALAELKTVCRALADCTWGRENILHMRHPLSAALPFARCWLDMPAQPLPGDVAMPRVQGRQFGASQRLVVAPGREQEGTFQMPGGPVDHPLSPFYGAGHDDWVRGTPQPLLPGPARHRLELVPGR